MTSSFTGRTWAAATSYLAGGKNKDYRPVSSNVYLARQGDGAISLVLHHTAIITYHENGLLTLDHAGWRTVTTLRRLNDYTPFRIGSTHDKKHPGWGLGVTGEHTPPRVTKCRTCKGTGGSVQRRECFGAPWYSWGGPRSEVACDGARTEHLVKWNFDNGTSNWAEHNASAYQVPCQHGAQFTERHRLTLCEHGNRERHRYGEIEAHECYRCTGEGTVDYGSKPIPIVWGEGPVMMHPDGHVVAYNVPRYYAPGKPHKYKPAPTYVNPKYPYTPELEPEPVEPSHHFGGETNRVLEALLPGLRDTVTCPACTGEDTHSDGITSMVIHLNDGKRWTREAIADWLDTLDADLRFPLPKEHAA